MLENTLDSYISKIIGNVWFVKDNLEYILKHKVHACDSGPVYHRRTREKLGAEARDTLLSCKARHLIVSLHQKGGYYKYDITPLGRSVLEEKERREREGYESRIKKYQRFR